MLTHSIIGMSRHRWQTQRPFAGYTTEALRRKLASDCLRDTVRGQIEAELQWRVGNELPGNM